MTIYILKDEIGSNIRIFYANTCSIMVDTVLENHTSKYEKTIKLCDQLVDLVN